MGQVGRGQARPPVPRTRVPLSHLSGRVSATDRGNTHEHHHDDHLDGDTLPALVHGRLEGRGRQPPAHARDARRGRRPCRSSSARAGMRTGRCSCPRMRTTAFPSSRRGATPSPCSRRAHGSRATRDGARCSARGWDPHCRTARGGQAGSSRRRARCRRARARGGRLRGGAVVTTPAVTIARPSWCSDHLPQFGPVSDDDRRMRTHRVTVGGSASTWSTAPRARLPRSTSSGQPAVGHRAGRARLRRCHHRGVRPGRRDHLTAERDAARPRHRGRAVPV